MIKKLPFLLLLFCFAHPAQAQSCASSWTNGYTYCRALTIASGQIPGSLTNFPALICFNMTLGNGNACPTAADLKTAAYSGAIQNTVTFNSQTCPADINFFSNNTGTTALPWDCASYVATSGALEAYVQIQATTGANYIYMFYDKSTQSAYTGGSVGAVWDSNFTLVHHLANGTSISYNDSTSNGNTGSAQGSGNAAAAGQLDGGLSLNGSGGESVASLNPAYTGITIEAWVHATSFANQNEVGSQASSSSHTGFNLYTTGGSNNACQVGNGTATVQVNGSVPTASAWNYLVCTWNATTIATYLNGTAGATGSQTGTMSADTGGTGIGYIYGCGGCFTGTIDEVRISNVARSANYITATYNAESAPSTWFSTSSASTNSGGGGVGGIYLLTAVINNAFLAGGSNPPTPPSPGCPTVDPAMIFDGACDFNATNYATMAAAFGTATMIPERYGNSWSGYHSSNPSNTAPTWSQPASFQYTNPSECSSCWTYTLGTSQSGEGDFSSNQQNVAYVYNSSISGSAPGVDGIYALNMQNYTWTGQPQLNWTYYGDGHPDPNLTPSYVTNPNGEPQQPIGTTRSYGASEAAAFSWSVFEDGQVDCTSGGFTNWNQSGCFYKPFPSNFYPTAESVTNNGEFLLVTGWNTSTNQGQLAVFALGSNSNNIYFPQYEWSQTYPGFRNYSFGNFLKLLGTINLTGMQAPTAVEGVGNWVYAGGNLLPGGLNPGQFPLTTQNNWECFVPGGSGPTGGQCTGIYDTAGFALVASRWERKVLLINLTPLFQAITAGMFGGTYANFNANVANTGTGAGQWPPTFAENPSETPTITATLTFTAPVTAISASLYTDNLALIATDDNTLRIYSVNGLQTGGPGTSPSLLYTLSVGNNVTRIAHMKHWNIQGGGDYTNGFVRYQYICVSRGDKTIAWVDTSGGTDSGITTPTIVRTLSDSRLNDPVSVEDNNNHGTYSNLIDVADYGASAVAAYRYGPVVFVTNGGASYGMGPSGTDPFEYEASWATPTGPFDISMENIE